MSEYKICEVCGQEKHISNFSKSYKSRCKKCVAAQTKEKRKKQTMNTNSIKDLKCPLSFEEKLELADWLAESFSHYCSITLTGSMLLKKLGIIDRESQDIDFIIADIWEPEGFVLPPFAKEVEFEKEDGYRVLKRFYWLGTKIEVIHDEDLADNIFRLNQEEADIKIVEGILKAKKRYLETETRPDQIAKHTEDIPRIEQWLATKRTKL